MFFIPLKYCLYLTMYLPNDSYLNIDMSNPKQHSKTTKQAAVGGRKESRLQVVIKRTISKLWLTPCPSTTEI
jgi:hypothetical protein